MAVSHSPFLQQGVLLSTKDFDVIIIGGGPGGSGMGCYLAKAGVSCLILERELFPRQHVGESLVPSSTRVFREIDFLDQMETAKFPHKFGAAWTSANTNQLFHMKVHEHDWGGIPESDRLSPEEYVDVQFSEREQPGIDMLYTYHVDRGHFDNLLLQHAASLGATVHEGVNVKSVDVDADGVTVHYDLGRRDATVTAQMVVDASGRRTVLGNQFGWKIKDPVFDQFALHTWFKDYDRSAVGGDKEKTEFIYIHFLPVTNTWVWQIPITEDITSIGVVTQKKNFARRKTEHEQFFWDCVGTRPEFAEALRNAEQIRPFKTEGDYSYAMSRIVDDRVVLIGDAARFVDPIFSTGVSIALNSARFASRDVIGALESGDFSASAFSTYETTIRRGTRNWHEFISLYYRLNVLFTAFVADPRYRLDVLKLLQGDVYDEDAPAVLTRMREIVSTVEQNPKHILHEYLGDLTSNEFAPTF
jgi:FADH2 O2-dependent halogenase